MEEFLWWALKIGFLVAFFVYLVFAAVVVRQVQQMSKIVSTPINWLLHLFAWLHLGFALLVLVAAFFIL